MLAQGCQHASHRTEQVVLVAQPACSKFVFHVTLGHSRNSAASTARAAGHARNLLSVLSTCARPDISIAVSPTLQWQPEVSDAHASYISLHASSCPPHNTIRSRRFMALHFAYYLCISSQSSTTLFGVYSLLSKVWCVTLKTIILEGSLLVPQL